MLHVGMFSLTNKGDLKAHRGSPSKQPTNAKCEFLNELYRVMR